MDNSHSVTPFITSIMPADALANAVTEPRSSAPLGAAAAKAPNAELTELDDVNRIGVMNPVYSGDATHCRCRAVKVRFM